VDITKNRGRKKKDPKKNRHKISLRRQRLARGGGTKCWIKKPAKKTNKKTTFRSLKEESRKTFRCRRHDNKTGTSSRCKGKKRKNATSRVMRKSKCWCSLTPQRGFHTGVCRHRRRGKGGGGRTFRLGRMKAYSTSTARIKWGCQTDGLDVFEN